MTTIMMDEILSENALLKKTFENNNLKLNELSQKIKDYSPTGIFMLSRGSSQNASLYFKYICEIELGIPVFFVKPSIITLYSGSLSFKNQLVIAVSQGGRGEDLNLVMDKAIHEKAFTIAITNSTDNPLAKKVDFPLCLSVNEEKSIAATKTFTAELLVLLMLVDAFNKTKKLDMIQLHNGIDEVYHLSETIRNLATKYSQVDELFIFSRGISLTIARELECKLQESCFVNAHSFATSDFSHGPIALAIPHRHAIMIASSDETEIDSLNFIKRVKSLGLDLSVITDSTVLFKEVGQGILLPKTNKWMFSIIAAVACQLFACHLASLKGINPDKSRNLEKYVITK